MSVPHVSVVGAGPAGLAAAIELARNGMQVTVYEAQASVGSRFHGDFQGMENWTTADDVRDWLERLHLQLDFPHRPVNEVALVTPSLERYTVHGDRPLVYLVRRGPGPDTLDRHLEAQARRLGVQFRLRRRIESRVGNGPTVWATGPASTQAVVAGIVAETSHPDQVVAIASDALAPRCYAYCIIWNRRATLATGLATRFREAWPCFEQARHAFERLGLTDFRAERRFGGRANIILGRPLQQDDQFWVGEAAGLQDYLLGFGLRYALLSGHLAARALLTGARYPDLLQRELGGQFRAGFVNRLIYNRAGERGYRWLIRWVARKGDVERRARRIYSMTFLHRALFPLAALAAPRAVGRRHDGDKKG